MNSFKQKFKLFFIIIWIVIIGFPFYGIAQNPGGVSGSVLWYKANAGVTLNAANLSGWNDFSGQGNNAIQSTAVNQPAYTANSINFNQAVTFSGSNYLTAPVNNLPAGTSARSIFIVASSANTQTVNSWVYGYGPAVAGQAFSIGKISSTKKLYVSGYTVDTQSTADFWTANVPKLGTVTYSAATTSYFDAGAPIGTVAQSLNTSLLPDSGVIGSYVNNFATDAWVGTIAEIISYPSQVTGNAAASIESYLAIKYGIHKTGNYLNSAGTIVWDAAANSAYDNDVFGIAKDDSSGLLQTQSNSTGTGSGDGTGQSAKGNIVISAPSSLVNNGFLMIGHNTSALAEFSQILPDTLKKRVQRIWKVQSAGNPGTVTLSYDTTGIVYSAKVPSDYTLLVDPTGTQNFTGQSVIKYSSASFSGSKVIFTGVSLPNGAVFTFQTIASPIITAAFTINKASQCQNTDNFVFTNTSTVLSGFTISSYSWDFGDGQISTAQSPSHIYTVPGTYTVKLQVTESGGGINSITDTVTVNPIAIAAISYPNASYCKIGTAAVTQTGETGGTYSSTQGLSINGTTGEVDLAKSSAGTYTITYAFTNGSCPGTTTAPITINALPIVKITNPLVVCAPATVDITAGTITTGSDSSLSYTYFTDAAGTTILENPNAVAASGTYYIKGTNSNGCSMIAPVEVIINAPVALQETESTICAADGLGYVLSMTVTGKAPFTATGTGAPGTWSGNTWMSDSIAAGTDYNVSIQDANACVALLVANPAPVCCVFEVVCPTFPETTIGSYDQLPTATTLTIADFEALGNGDGRIGNNLCGVVEITALNGIDTGCNNCTIERIYTITEYADTNNNNVKDADENTVLGTIVCTQTFNVVLFSKVAELSNLTIDNGVLTPAFTSDVLSYYNAVQYNVNSVVMTPTVTDPTATITINDVPVSNNGNISLALNSGDNIVKVIVTAEDGTTKEIYTINVYRGVSPDAVTANNILTPNGDGKNDYWEIKDINLYPNNSVTVFDRAGRIVYSKNNYNNEWNGFYQGSPLNGETYYYLIDLGSGLSKIKGFITIIRD